MYAFSSTYAFFKDSITGSQVDPNCRFICYNIFFINKGIGERFLFLFVLEIIPLLVSHVFLMLFLNLLKHDS